MRRLDRRARSRTPSIDGASRSISLPISLARTNEMLSGISTLANAIFPASGPCGAICGGPPCTYGLCDAHDVGDRRDLGEERLHLLLDFRVGDALLGPEHDGADLTGALAAELCVEDVEAATRLDVRKAELISARRADRASGGSDEHQEPDPDAEHQPSVVVTPRSQSQEQDGPPEVRSTLCRAQALTSRRE